jgi:CRISPR/Cas system CSM-associated protein Csm3 (group 7 of RAMP superfamily)
LSTRDGIAIDRFTGGVKAGPFNYQYVLDREFTTKIQIRNFELWQLGMLSFLLRDFEDELVPIGYGKTRGLGKVKGTVELMMITYYGLKKPVIDIINSTATITGVGELFDDPDNKEGYHFEKESSIEGIKFHNCKPDTIKTQIELNT